MDTNLTTSGTPGGNAMADLRFYVNNGPLVDGYASPGSILYDSGPFSIGPYSFGSTAVFNESDLGGEIVVPQYGLTWTVTFSGLVGNENAGLALFSAPTVGTNYGDAWVNNGSGWELVVPTNGVPPTLDFGAIVDGSAEVVPIAHTEAASAVAAASATLNGSANPKEQATAASFVWGTSLNFGNTNLAASLPAESGEHAVSYGLTGLAPGTKYYFMLVASNVNSVAEGHVLTLTTISPLSIQSRRAIISAGQSTDSAFQVQFKGVQGRSYVLQATTNLSDWISISTSVAPKDPFYFSDPDATHFPYRFYRVVPAPK